MPKAKKGLKKPITRQPDLPGIRLQPSTGRCNKCGGPVKDGKCMACKY